METPKRKYRVVSVIGQELEEQSYDEAALAFMEGVVKSQDLVIEAVIRDVNVVDLETGVERQISFNDLKERHAIKALPPKPAEFKWPGWWQLALIAMVGILCSAIDARGTLGAEWWTTFAMTLPVNTAIAMGSYLTGALIVYLIETRTSK